MKVAKQTMRREFLYFSLCVAFGLLVLPVLLIIVGDFLVERRIIFPEVFPSLQDAPALYRMIFSALLFSRDERGFLPIVIIFYCLFPYAVFQVFRWAFRGVRLLWERQHSI